MFGYFAAGRKRDDLHNTRYRQFESLMYERGGPMRQNPVKRQAEMWHLACAGARSFDSLRSLRMTRAVDGQLMTPSVMALAGDAPCHLPQRGRHFGSLPEGGYVGTFSAARGPHPAAARPPSPCAGKAMTPHPSSALRGKADDTDPPCGARKALRAYAGPRVFRPLRKRGTAFFCHRQRQRPFPPQGEGF